MKKIISLILAAILVLAMGVSAFALGIGSVPEHDHEWGDWAVYTWGRIRVCEECGVAETEYFNNEEVPGEDNPNTGAMSLLGTVAIVSAAAAFKRK